MLAWFLSTAAFAAPVIPFQFEGWPGEGVPVLTAKADVAAPLRAEAKPDSPEYGTCKLSSGSQLNWSMSTQVVRAPEALVVKTAKPLKVTSYGRLVLLTNSAYYNSGKEKTLSLAKGDTVEFLMPRAEGTCFFRHKGEVFTSECMAFEGAGKAVKSEWWVQAECGDVGGWMRVDSILDSFSQSRTF